MQAPKPAPPPIVPPRNPPPRNLYPPQIQYTNNQSNYGRAQNPYPRDPYPAKQAPVELIPTSSNPLVNGSQNFVPGRGKIVCINCGEPGHLGRDCSNKALSSEERTVLRGLVLFDRSMERPRAFSSSGESTPSSTRFVGSSANAHSVTYGVSSMSLIGPISNSAEVLIRESSGPNKTAHVEEPSTPPVAPPLRPTQPAVPPQPTNLPTQSNTFPSNLPAEAERPKKKGQRRTGKAATMAPLVGLLNEENDTINKTTSIRQILKSQKVNMSWMDFCVWSPTACRELKRLITRMSNKRKKKVTQPQSQPQSQTHPSSVANIITADGNTRFLGSLLAVDKAFRISCSIRVSGKGEIEMDRSQVQADQMSDMNVISTAMANQLELVINSLSDIGFAGMTMRTADQRETLLHS